MIFDLIQTAHALERLFGERRVLRDVHLKKMSPRMCHARNLLDARRNPGLCRQEQRLEAGVRIDLQLAFKARQMLLRIFAVPTRRVLIPHRRRIGGSPPSAIAYISPQVTTFGLAGTGGEHLDRGVIRIEVLGRQHMLGQCRDQGTEQLTGGPDPLHEGRAAQGHARVGEDLALPI
jgi:hypothetical protein